LPAPDSLSDPVQEARARNLQKELRCLVCQGESLDESNASLAVDLRRLIRARIKAGDSDEAIKNFLVSRYGDFILMQPPFETNTYALWLTPFAVLIVAAGIAAWVVFRARRRQQDQA
jgi:cytochrome c-type biogenesis protein CcmH